MNQTAGHVIGCQCFLCTGTFCTCVIKNREDGESQREWFKRWMCMYHWMQTDYYQAKLKDMAEALEEKSKRVEETCCGLPLTEDGCCRMSGEKIRGK